MSALIIFVAILALITAVACYFTERVDRPIRRAERLAAQAKRETEAA
ncbi:MULTISPECIES: hypothetical protein [unclassified Sphingosinithalassobacter]|nr:hypothetical protein [Sphingosinithalassobacter sp. CS137]